MHLAPIERLEALPEPTLRALRDALIAAGYGPDTVAEGERIAAGLFDALRLPLVHAAWREAPAPARELARLFLYDDVLEEARARALLGDEVAEALLEAGALARDDEGLRAAVLIAPFFELFIVSDPLHLHADAVMGPGPTTIYLADAIPSPAPPAVLDVGCGAGSLALLAAKRGATGALGVDISARAISIARLNATLNGLDARFERSDLTAAVGDARFDLVVSQPAFISQPPDVDSSVFAHGGARGDELAMRLLSELPARVARGGDAVVLLQDAAPATTPLHRRVREATRRADLGLVAIGSAPQSAEAYAIGYASVLDPSFGPRWRETALRYRAHLRGMGIESFTLALISLRDNGLGYTATLPGPTLRGFDAAALSALHDALSLAARPDDALARASVRCPERVAWIEERPRPDSSIEPTWRAQPRGVPFAERSLSEASWVLLGLLHDAATIADAVSAYADACGASPPEVAPQVLRFVREHLAHGLLEPAT